MNIFRSIKNACPVTALFYTILVAVVMASPAMAEKGGKGQKERPVLTYKVEEKDRLVLQGYLQDVQKRNCPPGLAKKNRLCMPPGQYKRQYDVGDILPANIFQSLPRGILKDLKPAPRDHRYVRVDQDVYLISAATRRIVDIISLL